MGQAPPQSRVGGASEHRQSRLRGGSDVAPRFAGDLRNRVPARMGSGSAPPRPGRGARARDARPLDRPRPRLDHRLAHRRHPHPRARGHRRAVGVPRRRHDRRREVRSPRVPPPMSYTLNGRIQSRLVASIPALVLALALHRWWAIELVALMLALGLVLDAAVYHRALGYQPGWLALPLGAIELALVYGTMRALDLMAPLRWALVLFGIGWVAAQLFGQALFPRLRL